METRTPREAISCLAETQRDRETEKQRKQVEISRDWGSLQVVPGK